MYDRNYFMESPRLIKYRNGYKLIWKYGEMGFYFYPRCKVKYSELLCSLQGTSSSGALKGQQGEITIMQPYEIEAIERNKAFWLEPDGTIILLNRYPPPNITTDDKKIPTIPTLVN